MDDSVLMAGVGSDVLDRAVVSLLVLGITVVAASLLLHGLQANWQLVRWAIRRVFHSCAACHAHDSSVALWDGLNGRSPLWLCAECAFRQDSDEVFSSSRQWGAQIAGRFAELGRAAASWCMPTSGGGGRHRRQRLSRRAQRTSSFQNASRVELDIAVRSTPSVGAGGRHRRRAATV